jgi:hypothetical protein
MARITKGQRVEVISGEYAGERGRVAVLFYDRRGTPSSRVGGKRFLVASLDMGNNTIMAQPVGNLRAVAEDVAEDAPAQADTPEWEAEGRQKYENKCRWDRLARAPWPLPAWEELGERERASWREAARTGRITA